MIQKKVGLDPERNSAAKWNCILFLCGVLSLLLILTFMYIRSVGTPNYIYIDWHLGAYLAMSISVVDAIFLCGTILKYHISSSLPKLPNASQRHDFNREQKCSKLSFIIDLLAILPLPQFLVGMKNHDLLWWLRTQIIFKIMSMSPTPPRTNNMMGVLMKNAWLGALQNLMYFIMISNGLGALYYDSYISMLQQCHTTIYARESDAASLNWDELITRCTENYDFEFGMFTDAFSTKIGTRSFIQKFTYCFAWGLKSLSSFGQIFSASSYSMDTLFSFFIVIAGLVLFGDLLARMQTALQCTEVKEDRQRSRQRLVEQWMKYHQLPHPLKKQVKQAIQSEWSANQGINDEAILDTIPWDIRTDIRRHLYLEIIRTIPLFKEMDEDLVNAICGHLRPYSTKQSTYVMFEGEPVHRMLFVFSGHLEVFNANNNGQCLILGPGDLCGKELLEWCSHPTTSTENLKPATQTIKCITDVDAFALRVDDLKLLAIQFHRNGKFRCAFQRYAS